MQFLNKTRYCSEISFIYGLDLLSKSYKFSDKICYIYCYYESFLWDFLMMHPVHANKNMQWHVKYCFIAFLVSKYFCFVDMCRC